MDKFVEYGPLIIVVLGFLWQHNVFTTPEQLEKKHREILDDCFAKFVSMEVFKEFQSETKEDFKEIKGGINDLYKNTNEIKQILMTRGEKNE